MRQKQLGALALLVTLLLSGCASSNGGSNPEEPPAANWNTISDRTEDEQYIGLWTMCDGPTLLYSSTRWDGNASTIVAEPSSAACVDVPLAQVIEGNTDVHKGWVTISNRTEDENYIGLWKRCVETTLVYASTRWNGNASGLTIVPNDAQCVTS